MIIAKSITHFVQNEQLKMQNHYLEMLTATISHDMRTPLNAILGMGKSIERYVQGESGKKFHQVIMNSAALLQFLVNDLLDLFRIKNGKFLKNEDTVDFPRSLQELMDVFQL